MQETCLARTLFTLYKNQTTLALPRSTQGVIQQIDLTFALQKLAVTPHSPHPLKRNPVRLQNLPTNEQGEAMGD